MFAEPFPASPGSIVLTFNIISFRAGNIAMIHKLFNAVEGGDFGQNTIV